MKDKVSHNQAAGEANPVLRWGAWPGAAGGEVSWACGKWGQEKGARTTEWGWVSMGGG